MLEDKTIEKKRYDARALSIIENDVLESPELGSVQVPLVFRTPYIFYEKKIKELIHPTYHVLEIGSGTGLHTYSIIKTGAHVTASDISPNSLKVLEKNFSKARLQTVVADMEQLPFENESFDVVTCAGSLSYGDAEKVDSEIHRVIKPSGFFICVDSLNNNPVYRLNRFIHYLKKERTKKTLLNMPTYQRIVSLRSRYKDADVNYFGSISFITQLLSKILGPNYTSLFSDYVDKTIKAKKSAFKFVLIAKV